MHASALKPPTRFPEDPLFIITVAQFAITFVPFLQRIFGTQAVPLLDGIIVVCIGVALLILLEGEKQLRLRYWKPE